VGSSWAGYDVLVVTVSSAASARWWSDRLEAGREHVAGDAKIAVVVEDRPAGTAHGTLLALRAARAMLGDDALVGSAGVFHAAGAGTRLEPLTSRACEKPRVRLPGVVRIDGRDDAITLLEAVIRSANPWAAAGRVAVWWGDQLFEGTPAVAEAPVSLLVQPLADAEAATWASEGLHAYGVVATDAPVAHVEKADRATFVRAIGREPSAVARSLGVFSADPALLAALADVSAPDLAAGRRLDTDRGWWMPLTLTSDGYAHACAAAGLSEVEARAWHARLAPIRERFAPVLGVAPVRAWWDFGTLAHYERNVRLASEPGSALRAILDRITAPTTEQGGRRP